ncbi:MAG: hypothetical protein KF745_08020 [Phycisphaeraceae bacterium]|nr:hypothetical protein [Phycisphaeraceae bacterium]
MDPREVDSSQDIRDGWDEWSYSERLEALEQLANSTLDSYAYDTDVDVDTGDTGDVPGYYDDGLITLDPAMIEDPDPSSAIHVTNHETVHAMNEEDGIDDYSYSLKDDDDFDFTEDDLRSMEAHKEVGDTARELDNDGFSPVGGGGGGGVGGGAAAAESASDPDAPKPDDFEFDIDWGQGVWIDSTDESGQMSVDILFAAPEGW